MKNSKDLLRKNKNIFKFLGVSIIKISIFICPDETTL